MSSGLTTSEAVYRIVDGIFRVHRDLFEIETILSRNATLQHRLTRVNSNGRMGALVAGLLAIVPILISLGDIKWQSAPAITVYALAAGVVLLWIYQVVAAGRVDRELASLGYISTAELEDRMDFILEETNAWVVRHRLIGAILHDLRAEEGGSGDTDVKIEREQRRARYTEVLSDCEAYIEGLIEASDRLVKSKKRSPDHHAVLLDWAAAIPRFATRGHPDQGTR